MMITIDKKDISIIVQGAVTSHTPECLRTLRKVFGASEIILSTWPSDKDKIDTSACDNVICSDDPGAFLRDDESDMPNNINRQIVSTQAGIAVATRKYILKTRSDLIFDNDRFIRCYEKHHGSATLFKDKLLVLDYYTRNPRILSMMFHPSDWLVFGLADDVRRYYKIPLQSEKDGMYYATHENSNEFFTHVYARFAPEQHICISFLKALMNVKCDSYCEGSPALVHDTEKFFAENIIVVDCGDVGIHFPKYNPNRYFERMTLMTHSDWRALHRHYSNDGSDIAWRMYLAKCAVRRFVFFDVRGAAKLLLEKLHLRQFLKRQIERKGRSKICDESISNS